MNGDRIDIGGTDNVAAGTVGVVRRGFGSQLNVGIVASGTGKVSVVRVVTAAIEQSIRLEADITNAAEVRHHGDRIHTAMASAAKFLRQFFGRKLHWIEDAGIGCIARVHGGDVGRSGAMTTLTTHAGNYMIESKLIVDRSRRAVAAKAVSCFGAVDIASGCFLETWRRA